MCGRGLPTHTPSSTCVSHLCCVASVYGPAKAAPAAPQPQREPLSSPRAGSRGTAPAGRWLSPTPHHPRAPALGSANTRAGCGRPASRPIPASDACVARARPSTWTSGPFRQAGCRASPLRQAGAWPRPRRPHGPFPLCQPRPTAGPQSPRNSRPQVRPGGCFLFSIRKKQIAFRAGSGCLLLGTARLSACNGALLGLGVLTYETGPSRHLPLSWDSDTGVDVTPLRKLWSAVYTQELVSPLDGTIHSQV